MGSPAASPLLTLGLKSSLKPSTHTFESLELDFFCVFRPALCVLCCVSPPQERRFGSFPGHRFRVVDATPRCSSLISGHSKWQLGRKRGAFELSGRLYFFSSPSTASAKKKLARCRESFPTLCQKITRVLDFEMCCPDLRALIAQKQEVFFFFFCCSLQTSASAAEQRVADADGGR